MGPRSVRSLHHRAGLPSFASLCETHLTVCLMEQGMEPSGAGPAEEDGSPRSVSPSGPHMRVLGCVHRALLMASLADKLAFHNSFFGFVISSPQVRAGLPSLASTCGTTRACLSCWQSTAMVVLGLYAIMLSVWFPLYVLSFTITVPGVYIFIGGSIYYGGRTIGVLPPARFLNPYSLWSCDVWPAA
jgi:hypothetical protein